MSARQKLGTAGGKLVKAPTTAIRLQQPSMLASLGASLVVSLVANLVASLVVSLVASPELHQSNKSITLVLPSGKKEQSPNWQEVD